MSERSFPRLALRTVEALVLSAFAGLFVWILTHIFIDLPIVVPAFMGFLAGGTAVLRTFGVVILRPGRRAALAVACAVVAWVSLQGANYAVFRHTMQRSHRASDYRLTHAEIEQRIDASLFRLTGFSGPVGYARAAVLEGTVVGPGLRLRGFALLCYWMVDLATAVIVATLWARGPARSPAQPA